MTRIYYPHTLQENEILELKDERTSHYLKNVKRCKVGTKIILFNGQGNEYIAEISQINKKNMTVTIQQLTLRDCESPLQIHLAQGIAKGEKMDFIIQKATELGVQKITPIVSEYGNVHLSIERQEKRLQHWQAISISACEQSGRTKLPQIMPITSLDNFINKTQHGACFVLSPHAQQKLNHTERPSRVTLLIGPEGGFSESEIEFASKNQFHPLKLGQRILRTETAPIVAISIFQHLYGDL